MKRILSIMLILVMLFSMLPAAFAADGQWMDYGNNQWAYQNGDGSWAYNWQEINGNWYYFGSDGWMKTGWQEINGSYYYFYNSGVMAADTTIDGYYLNSSGAWESNGGASDQWVNSGGLWAYQFANGSWAYNWLDIDGIWYYFGNDGWMKTGWQSINNVWYYFETDGSMVTGWKQIDGNWYYFDGGAMAADRTLKIDGKEYSFLSDGRLYETEEISASSAINRENILRFLDIYDPDGAYIVRNSKEDYLLSFFNGASSLGEGIYDMHTAVHEQCHLFLSSHATLRYNNVVGDWMIDNIWVYTGNGEHLQVPTTDVFPSSEMVNSIPDELKTFRFNTYVNGDANTGSIKYGAYGLLDEFTAYCWGEQDEWLVRDFEYENDIWPRNTNGYLAYMEFRYYILHYLLFAWDNYRDVYYGIVNNESFRRAFSIIDDTFAVISERANTGWASGYYALQEEMAKPEYVEMAQILHS